MSFGETQRSPLRSIFIFYSAAIILFTLLFMLPISSVHGLKFIDALFLSSSGISVTGLSTINITTDLTRIGQAILLVEIQFGGIGIMVFITYLFLLLGKELSLPQLLILSADQNQRSIKSIRNVTLIISLITFIAETLGFTLMYPVISHRYDNPFDALFVTTFHSVSSFTNAGFDLFGDGLMDYNSNPIMILSTCLLIALGVVGFPTIIEFVTRRGKKKSLYTKVNLTMHITLWTLGFILIFLTEFKHSFQSLSVIDKFFNSLFLSVSSRSGGIASTDTSLFSNSTMLIVIILMFIGASPSSVGGGIRTTTFTLILSKMWSIIKGREETILFNRSIHEEDFNKAFLITTSFIVIFTISFITLSAIEHTDMTKLAFEIMSALTTTGLSTGITSSLTTFSKVWLIVLMFIGRIGVISCIYLFVKPKKSKTKFIKESIIVG